MANEGIMRTNGLIYRKGDPLRYGAICGNCQKRFGQSQPKGEIDITRCERCPPFTYVSHRSEQTGRSETKIARDKRAYLKKRAELDSQKSLR